MNGPQIQFFGNLTRDPEQRFSRNDGNPYATADVAVNTYRGPDLPQETTYFKISLYGRQAENLLANGAKGHQVFVQGRYGFRTYDRQDGTLGLSHEVFVREFRILNRPRNAEAPPKAPDQPDETPDDNHALTAAAAAEEDGDLPYESEE